MCFKFRNVLNKSQFLHGTKRFRGFPEAFFGEDEDYNYNHEKHFLYRHGFHLCLTNDDAINYLKSIIAANIEAGYKRYLMRLERIVVVKCSVPFGGSYVIG